MFIIEKNVLLNLVKHSIKLAFDHEILFITSNKTKTCNISDYEKYSTVSEFFSDEEELHILQSLKGIGFSVRQFFEEEDFIAYISSTRENLSKKIVINSAQKGTKIGRKSLIPALCDLYNISYTGSNPYVVSLCRDKYRCGAILQNNNIRTPSSWLYQPQSGWISEPPSPTYLYIAKPNYEASSIGIDTSNVCMGDSLLKKVKELSHAYHQEILVEEFIPGYEVEVPVVSIRDPHAFFPVGINLDGNPQMGNRILDYNLRRLDAYEYFNFAADHCILSEEIAKTAEKTAKLLNINGFCRIDFRINENSEIYVTDIASNPHYTLRSSYWYAFKELGLSYDDLIACLVATAKGGDVL